MDTMVRSKYFICKVNKMDIPLVITYDNAPTDQTRFLLKTLLANGWDYKIIGTGEKWEGFISKLNGYLNFLNTLPKNKLVIVSDARDVLCVRSPKAFFEAFSTFKSNLVVSAELFCCGKFDVPDTFLGTQCIPLTNYWKYHNTKSMPMRKFVNSGLIAGRVENIIGWLQWAVNNKFEDDQLSLCEYINNFPEKVILDTEAILLHTTLFGINAGVQKIHFQAKDAPTFAELYGRAAFFIHIPGCVNKGQKCLYDDICKVIDLGLCETKIRQGYYFEEPPWNGYTE